MFTYVSNSTIPAYVLLLCIMYCRYIMMYLSYLPTNLLPTYECKKKFEFHLPSSFYYLFILSSKTQTIVNNPSVINLGLHKTASLSS